RRWRRAIGQRRPRPRGDRRAADRRPRPVTATAGLKPAERAATLVEALPYIRRFAGKIVVVKYGGNALAGTTVDDPLELFAEDIVLRHQVGMRPVVVHGGGPQISELMNRLGMEAEFRNGLRV